MEELARTGGIIMIVMVGLQAMMLLYRLTSRRLNAARLDGEFLQLMRQLSASTSELKNIPDEITAPVWQGKRKFQVTWREFETPDHDICSFYLTPCDAKPIPGFLPGQFVTFEMKIPGRPNPVIRCYSLSDSPTQRQYYRITVKLMVAPATAAHGTPPGVSSAHFHDHMHVGEVIEAHPPSGSFCLEHNSARPLVLIAGGVGITPFLSILNWLTVTTSRQEVWLFYGVTNRFDHAMHEHLQAIIQNMPNIRVVTFYSDPTPACRHGEDYDLAGFVSVDWMGALIGVEDYGFYVCGPPGMMKKITGDLQQWGVPAHDIFTESFAHAPESETAASGAPHHAEVVESAEVVETADVVETLAVNFVRSNKTVQWAPYMGSLLELAEASGIKVPFTCRSGICGTCATAVSHGDVEYAQQPAQTPAQGYCLPCVARPRTDLMLDL